MIGIFSRFRENYVAICGDISNMYHRFLIPKEDQHVCRYLCRNAKVDKLRDVHVKTVVTTREKPAPAMTQTALRKTAKIAQRLYPVVSQTLAHNLYIDA